MARVYLGIGSNVDRDRYIKGCLDALTAAYGQLQISTVFESEAVGFESDPFYNLVVGLDTDQGVSELSAALRRIEHAHDRCRKAVVFSARTLDIDILIYDDYVGRYALEDGSGGALPRAEITQNAFVLQPLAEIAPYLLHPVLKRSYRQLWQAYDKSCQSLWPVSFIWQGRQLSR